MQTKVPAPDPTLTTAIYSFAEASRILAVPSSTLHHWATGYSVKRTGGQEALAFPLVTTSERRPGSRASVPFIGLAEAYTLLAFKAAGVPVQRIRPAIKWLEQHMGLAQALASERLMTDGAEVLFDFAAATDNADARDAVDGLVVVRSGQQVFRPVVHKYLSRVEHRNGWISLIHLPGYHGAVVTVDPLINGGRPTLARRGIPVDAALGRLRAGEDPDEVATDYRLHRSEIEALRAHI